MLIQNLKQYTKLYNSARTMGSAHILRKYLGLERDCPIPLSISHGVDMNHIHAIAMDVNAVEPIHWAYNPQIQQRTLTVKPTVKLPHPWLLLRSENSIKPGSGILVIGPPPGKSNDENLLRCLNDQNINTYDLLLKFRGSTDVSQDFWQRNGVQTVTAGPSDEYFYERLFKLLNQYETVIGCTLSSALFFAASIGRKCELLQKYWYIGYDAPNYLEQFDFDASIAKQFTRLLCLRDYQAACTMASEVLGSAYMASASELKNRFNVAIDAIQNPVFFKTPTNQFTQATILAISLWFGKSGMISLGFKELFRSHFSAKFVSIIRINEIDIWINGLNTENCQVREIPYKKGITEPGWAVD